MKPFSLLPRIIAIASASTLLACYVAHRQKQQTPVIAPGSKSINGPIFVQSQQTKVRPVAPGSKSAPIDFTTLKGQLKPSDFPVPPAPEQTATPQQ